MSGTRGAARVPLGRARATGMADEKMAREKKIDSNPSESVPSSKMAGSKPSKSIPIRRPRPSAGGGAMAPTGNRPTVPRPDSGPKQKSDSSSPVNKADKFKKEDPKGPRLTTKAGSPVVNRADKKEVKETTRTQDSRFNKADKKEVKETTRTQDSRFNKAEKFKFKTDKKDTAALNKNAAKENVGSSVTSRPGMAKNEPAKVVPSNDNVRGRGRSRGRSNFNQFKKGRGGGGMSQSCAAVFQPEVEEEDVEDLQPHIVKLARQSGTLNLANRSLIGVPPKVWTINEPDESELKGMKKGLSLDKIEDDNWWDHVDLTKLILASNQIARISANIQKLSSLSILDLHDNCLTCLPGEIGQLENLTKLNLSHNKLASLPLGFFDLKSLRILSICHNELTDMHEDFGRLDLLENLDLSHNSLKSITSNITCLSKVHSFSVNNNSLVDVPHEISFMRSLMLLELSHNKIVALPDSLQDLHSLERLYVHHNNLKSMPVLKSCQHLKEVHLGYNRIEELTDGDIENMANVKLLDLRDNKIPLLPDELINLQGLERLDVSNNDLGTLPFTLGTLPHLKVLQVEGNPMKSIRRDIIQRGTVGLLRYLRSRIDDEELARLREKGNISPVPSVSSGSPPIPDKFVMKSAQVMNLSKKEMTSLPKEAVQNALEAEVNGVDLSKNYFDKFPAQLEPLMGHLFELNLSSNRLEALPASLLGMGVKLQYVNFAGNKLSQLPPEMGLLGNLREVCLNCNRFEAIPTCLYGLAKLETLLMSDNRVTTIPVDQLSKLTNLAVLDLANNSIGHIPPELGNLTHIRTLQLDGNAFRMPRPQILVKGTASVMAYLRDRIPRDDAS